MKNGDGCNCHRLIWDDAKISRFWNFIALSGAHQDDYFAKQVGRGVVNFLRNVVTLEGRILDYGCGPGYMAGCLIEAGIQCEGCDSSEVSVTMANEKFKENPLWRGAQLVTGEPLPYEDNLFDLILCLETIEHVLDSHLEKMLTELYRILKPETGVLFITTPNNEDLESFTVFCPDCGAVLHRYQHVRSFTASSLDELMRGHGFRTESCNTTLFNSFQETSMLEPLVKHPLDWSLRYVTSLIKIMGRSVFDRMSELYFYLAKARFNRLLGHGCHLFWLGKKRACRSGGE
jgi:2-polyprenyl-3-methyl-5-hydroxy-6-metoxy-1,4-benzoquinol methylase